MGDFPSHLVQAPPRPRFSRAKALTIWAVTIAFCLTLTSANAAPVSPATGWSIAGMDAIGSPPGEPSWAPAPVASGGLHSLATAAHGQYALHTISGDRTFLPGVNLGPTTPGHLPGELATTAAQYKSWFAAMAWLGIRAVRIATIHPPAFYQQLAAHNRADPDRPLYLMQGVYFADPSPTEIRDASAAVTGNLVRAPRPGRASGTWTADVTPWLLGWTIDADFSPVPEQPVVDGRYFASAAGATPTERWLAARMEELAGRQAAQGLSQPIASAGHVRVTARWPAGMFAPVTDLSQKSALPRIVTAFGVASSTGISQPAPRGRSVGGHSEEQAMAIDAQLLREIHETGLAGGFLRDWTDQWYRPGWNTSRHQDPERRQLWHDPMTAEQHFGLIATDAAGPPDQPDAYLVDDETAWPARRITARTDEAAVHLRITLGDAPPSAITVGFDVLPALTGPAAPGSGDRWADAALTLDLVTRTGQAYLRRQLDPLPLDAVVPAARRGPAPAGWRRFELLTSDDPPVLQNAGALSFSMTGADVQLRVPWALLGFADPSAHSVAVPRPRDSGVATLTTQFSPGLGVTVSADGTDQQTGEVSWVNWNRPYCTERLKQGAGAFRDAALDVTRSP